MINNTTDLFSKIWVLDESAINKILREALEKGRATIYDGVAYWAEGSGKTGIIQHLKFTERSVDASKEILDQLRTVASSTQEMTQILQNMNNMLMATQVLSSVAILGAIVVQTQYLGQKLDAIQDTVDEISLSQHEQNLVFYMDKIGDYMGSVEYARTLLHDRTLAQEINGIALALLPQIGAKRHHILSLVDNIAGYVRIAATERSESKNFKLMLDFIHFLMDAIPAALHTEHLLAARIGKPRLAQEILLSGAEKYDQALGNYRNMMNQINHQIVQGNIGEQGVLVFMETKPKLLQLIDSPANKLLLFRQPVKIAA